MLSTPPAFVLSQDQTLMFNPHPQLRRPLGLAKVLASSLRQGVSLIRNLTVLSLSSFSLCIVFKYRPCRRSVARDNVDYYTNAPIICQGFSAKNFTHNILWFISCILCYILRFLAVFSRKSREFELLRNRFFKKKTATGSIQMTHTRPCFSAESPEKVGTSPGKALSSSR